MPRRYFCDWMPKQKQNRFWAEPAASFQLSSSTSPRFQAPIYANWVFRCDRATMLHRWMEVDKRCECGLKGFKHPFLQIFNLFQSRHRAGTCWFVEKWNIIEVAVTREHCLLLSSQLLSIKKKWSNLCPPPLQVRQHVSRLVSVCVMETEVMCAQRPKDQRQRKVCLYFTPAASPAHRYVAIEICHSITVATRSPHSGRAGM